MTHEIEIERNGAVLCATIARPEKKNALTGSMYDELTGALEQAASDGSVGAVLIAGKGGVFTAGNDIGDFIKIAMSSGGAHGGPGWRFISALAGFGKPLVAAVEGQAIGIGTTLCFHCDLVYATPDARFHMPFVNLGLVPEAGSSMLAPMRFGYAKAAEFLLLAEPFGAEAARDLGLVNAIVPGEGLHTHALDKAKALAAKPRSAVIATRKLMRGDPAPLKARMEQEIAEFGAAIRSPDAMAAFQAFLSGAKR